MKARQANLTEPDAPVPSVAVTVTVLNCSRVGVPVITPAGLIDSPRGRPVAV
jgi:hypothetical protein